MVQELGIVYLLRDSPGQLKYFYYNAVRLSR